MKRSKLGPGKHALERGSTFRTPAELDMLHREAFGVPMPSPSSNANLSALDRQAWGTRRSRMGASKAQVAKRNRMGACIVTGDTEGVDSAHLWDRSLGGCNSADCVVPLRRDIHEAYDHHEFDLLPYLLASGCIIELQHALGHANGNLIGLLERLTGETWVPERRAA